MSNSFKADLNQVKQIIEYYSDHQKEVNQTNIYFKASTDDFSVLIYSNLTVLFQGKKATEEYRKWNKIEESESINLDTHMGSDEVGCGDYFGPIVVSAALVEKDDIQYLLDIGVKDSKQLNDAKIKEIAPLIISKIKSATLCYLIKNIMKSEMDIILIK